jgi:AFG3 family protein
MKRVAINKISHSAKGLMSPVLSSCRILFEPGRQASRFFSHINLPDDDPKNRKSKDENIERLKELFSQYKTDFQEYYYKNTKRSYMILALVLGVGCLFYFRNSFYPTLSFYDLIKSIERGEVNAIEIEEYYQDQKFKSGYCYVTINNSKYRIQVIDTDILEHTLEMSSKEIKISYRTKVTYKEVWHYTMKLLWAGIIVYLLQKVIRAKRGSPILSGQADALENFKKSHAKKFMVETKIKKKFKDVAGMEEAKREISEFVEFLKSPEKFKAMGAKLPKGALLSGPPGTGKTLLGKACAGEANVPFFSVNGSEFMEMFVGVGASRVRDLFKQAKENSPSIIFIDEIDAIGRKRSSTSAGGSEADSTLNQLLVEMDGFGTDSNVVVFAASNRKELLDPALLRPGRLDRQIEVNLPDLEARRQIFKVHLNGLNLGRFDESSFSKFASKLTGSTEVIVDNQPSNDQNQSEKSNLLSDRDEIIENHAKRLASLTPGFAGADIENICNEAAIQAVRTGDSFVQTKHFEMAVERIIGGLPRKSMVSKKERETVAVHESGHGVVSWFLKGAAPLLKLTIIPRSKGSLGFAQYLPNEMSLESEEELLDTIVSVLAGRCAEEEFFGKVTTGAYDDLQKAFKIAHSIVTKLGMSKKIGLRSLEQNQYGIKPYSEETNKDIDEECKRIITECTDKCRQLVKLHRHHIEKMSQTLLEKETIDLKTITGILGNRPFPPREGFKAYLENA